MSDGDLSISIQNVRMFRDIIFYGFHEKKLKNKVDQLEAAASIDCKNQYIWDYTIHMYGRKKSPNQHHHHHHRQIFKISICKNNKQRRGGGDGGGVVTTLNRTTRRTQTRN